MFTTTPHSSTPSQHLLTPEMKPGKVFHQTSSPFSSQYSISTLDHTHHLELPEARLSSSTNNLYFNPRATISAELPRNTMFQSSILDNNMRQSASDHDNRQRRVSLARSAVSQTILSPSIVNFDHPVLYTKLKDDPTYNPAEQPPLRKYSANTILTPTTKVDYAHPSFFNRVRDDLTSKIKEEVLRESEIRRRNDMESMENMIRASQTYTDMVKFDRAMKPELERSRIIVENIKRSSVPVTRGRDMSTPPRMNQSQSQSQSQFFTEVKRGNFQEQRILNSPSLVSLPQTRESWISTSYENPVHQPVVFVSSQGKSSEQPVDFKNLWRRKLMEEIENEKEYRRRKDLESMEDMVRKRMTITNIVLNDQRRQKELAEMKNLRRNL